MRPAAEDQLVGDTAESWEYSPDRTQITLKLRPNVKFHNLPPVFEVLARVVEAAPGALQGDLSELINALYENSPTETIHFLRQVLSESSTPMTATTLRRISPSLPRDLVEAVRDLVKSKNIHR